jgi:hypothetical protein
LQVAEPGAVRNFAEQDRADKVIVLQDETFINAGAGVADHNLLPVVAIGEIANREQIDAGDLELGRRVAMDEGDGCFV